MFQFMLEYAGKILSDILLFYGRGMQVMLHKLNYIERIIYVKCAQT